MKRVRTWLVMAWLAISFRFANADDWQHWRGPNRNGITSETSGWRNGTWLSAEPRWRARVGEGSTSPLVVGDRVFVMGWSDQKDTVRCLDANTGRELWLTSYACPRYGRQATGDEGFYAGPTSTP
ncbi:MAG: PQQ-binding-like beta-propeller repeat protein [Planctomycetales bacterium]|nr:PQQ-binding-like beta-propeller repeat protein [Planctomycetales bacterium]